MTAYKKFIRLRYIVFADIIVLLLFPLISCAPNASERQTSINDWLHSVVEIQVRDENDVVVGNATGTVIDKYGHILTNKHVVRSYDFQNDEYLIYNNIFIRWYNSEDYITADIIAISQNSDLALLKIEEETNYFFELRPDVKVTYGDRVHTIGNGNGYGLSYSNGYISAPRRQVKYDGEIIEAIQIDMNIYEGNSGGPLINENGSLIGITTFRLRDNRNEVIYGSCFAIPIDTICDFVNVAI